MKKLLSLLIAAIMIFATFSGAIPVGAETSGTCGDDLMWSYDTSTYTLSISGKGDMINYSESFNSTAGATITTAPWSDYYNSMKTVVISYGVTSIGSYAFCGFRSLTFVTISDSVTEIGRHAFSGCCSLTSITIPDSVTSIGSFAFDDCTSLTSITIPDSVMDIGGSAFSGCSSLNYNTYDNAKYLGNSENPCVALIEAVSADIISCTINNNSKVIADYAFFGCSKLTSITIPDSVMDIGGSAFSGCSSLNYNTYDNAKYLGNSENPCVALIEATGKSIASCAINSNTKVIYSNAFSDCTLLTSVTIPDSVTEIGDYAFYGCSRLTSINIPDSVTEIGLYAFYDCTSLTSVTIPDSVTEIGGDAFYGCTSLTFIAIPDSVTSIGSSVFSGCISLTSVTIPDSVTSIGLDAFGGCSSLTTVTIPDSVTSIGSCAFSSCTSLTSITIPDSVTSIGSFAFDDCTSLTSVAIPDSVTSIGDLAFYGCSKLTSITIPNRVTSIGDRAFSVCSSLKSITVDTGNPVYHSDGNCLIETETKTLIVGCKNSIIPSDGSVTSIGDSAFHDCTSLTSVTIPDSVTSIERLAFYNCTGLIEITIPGSVTSIGDSVFHGCTSLTSITIPGNVEFISDYAFGGCYSLNDVYYSGNAESWSSILVASGNNDLLDARIHYNAVPEGHYVITEQVEATCTGNGYIEYECPCGYTKTEYLPQIEHNPDTFIGSKEATCTESGYSIYICSNCGEEIHNNYVDPLGHSFENGVCTNCGMAEEDCIESSHPYGDDEDNTWLIHKDGAISVTITFSSETETEYGFDFIYIYDKNDNCIGQYSGTDLASRSIKVVGDTVKIRLTSDGIVSKYGFAIANVSAETGSLCGTCGDNLTWSLDTESGELTISGFGEMYNYMYPVAPWYDYREEIKSVILPKGLTSIGEAAFEMCDSLVSVRIPESVIYIGSFAFSDCTGLTSVVIPGSVTSIGNGAFYCCTGLTSIVIPKSVTSIGDSAFFSCSGLKSITVESGNTAYHSGGNCLIETETKTLIAGCNTSVIPSDGSVTSIGDGAFSFYEGLTSIIIPESVTSIGSFAFDGCVNLSEITIPNSVTFIGDFVFYFSGLNSINVEPYNTVYHSDGNCLIETETKTLIAGCNTSVIPSDGSVTSIGDGAFSCYGGLTSIIIPSGVTSIGIRAFSNCNGLTSIVIPGNVTLIETNAFIACTSLSDVYYIGTENDWNEISINNNWNGNDPLLNATIHFVDDILDFSEFDIDVESSFDPVLYGTTLIVEKDAQGANIAIISDGYDADSAEVYDIYFEKDGEKVQPSGEVTVKIPVPEGMNGEDCKVFWISDDEAVDMNAEYIDGFLVFKTDHFSYYAVVEQKKTDILIGDIDGSGKLNMKDLLLLRKVLAGAEELDLRFFNNADADGNGDINMKDVLKLRKIIAGAE